jgi:hypothetical protein
MKTSTLFYQDKEYSTPSKQSFINSLMNNAVQFRSYVNHKITCFVAAIWELLFFKYSVDLWAH